ncbi:MAG: NAD(P)-dependent alcohol dehydrogenase, partial [Acidobacteria bacterium]|nr:NAD(P)-dependent alcohol dehydrogenase [Acidobacteriota bacterium]
MIQVKGYAVDNPKDKFHPWNFERRDVGPNDILIEIE